MRAVSVCWAGILSSPVLEAAMKVMLGSGVHGRGGGNNTGVDAEW